MTIDRLGAVMNSIRTASRSHGDRRPGKGEAAYHIAEHVSHKHPGLLNGRTDEVELIRAAGYKGVHYDTWPDLERHGGQRLIEHRKPCRFCP